MRKFFVTLLLILSLSAVLAACGGGGEEASNDGDNSVGNAENGERLYRQTTIGSANAPGCITCHSLEEDTVLVGPSHAHVATSAAQAVEGMSAEEYIRESITDPNVHIVEGFTEGVMYQNYGEELTQTQINDLTAFLLTKE